MKVSDQPYRKENSVPTKYEDQWASEPAGLDLSEKRKNSCLAEI
jgi:hypothetical protein